MVVPYLRTREYAQLVHESGRRVRLAYRREVEKWNE
jgi:hypothetical protein